MILIEMYVFNFLSLFNLVKKFLKLNSVEWVLIDKLDLSGYW